MSRSERPFPWKRHAASLVRWLGLPALLAASWLAFFALLLLLWLFALFTPSLWVIGYLVLTLVMSGVELVAYWRDKRAAEQDRSRVAERTLLIYAALGGWPGAVVAGRLLRHKTLKPSYGWRMTLTVAAHIALIVLYVLASLNR